MQAVLQPEGDVERDVFVRVAVDQAHGAVDRDVRFEQSHRLAGSPKSARRDLGSAVWKLAPKCFACGEANLEVIGKAPLREVGRGGDADQRRDPLRPAQRKVQGDPATHRRADQDDGALGQLVQHEQRLIRPPRERAVLECAFRRPGPRIVEVEASAARASPQTRRAPPPSFPPCPTHSRGGRRASARVPGAGDRPGADRRLVPETLMLTRSCPRKSRGRLII